ncbi:MAG: twin transmembrane helix small protein [Sphingomonadales bacterium]|jgi:hypothetical protein|nr:twin transmembrane helix small protein [Sphingomonadales bacterium]
MTTVLLSLTSLAVAVVFVVLLAGLWNMSRGASANTSQKLMRWRVALQFVAILILMLAIFLSR